MSQSAADAEYELITNKCTQCTVVQGVFSKAGGISEIPRLIRLWWLKTSSSQSACCDIQGEERTETSAYNGWLPNRGFTCESLPMTTSRKTFYRNVKISMQLHPTNLAITQQSPGQKDMSELKFWDTAADQMISLSPFLRGRGEPRGCNWPFPSHSMLYHFHSSIYHWREMEKGHFVCVFSASHDHCDYMSPAWMLSQISTLKLTS